MRVYPTDPSCYNKPLWVIYGPDCFPSILACKLKQKAEHVVIWGYSIYRRSPGFRTLGLQVEAWVERVRADTGMVPEFYDDHEEALEKIRKLTTPKGAK